MEHLPTSELVSIPSSRSAVLHRGWDPTPTPNRCARLPNIQQTRFLAFPPQPQELRARKLGSVIVDTTLDRPWSQYFRCVVATNRQFIANYPIATKRALRAFMKAADLCAQEPERVARFLVTKGYEPRYAMAVAVLKKLPYSRWRETNPEDTTLLRPAPSRGRDDQIQAAGAHRAGDELAVLERAQERAKGVNQRSAQENKPALRCRRAPSGAA